MILAYAVEQGDKMALSGVRNPILGKANVAAAPSSSPGKVRGDGQRRKREGGCVCAQAGAGPQALLGLVTHSCNL